MYINIYMDLVRAKYLLIMWSAHVVGLPAPSVFCQQVVLKDVQGCFLAV